MRITVTRKVGSTQLVTRLGGTSPSTKALGSFARSGRLVAAFVGVAAVLTGPAARATGPEPAPPDITIPAGPTDVSSLLTPGAPTLANAPAPTGTLASSCPPAPYGVHYYAPGSGKTVALTFDDGPGPSSHAIRKILADNKIPATFFNLGANMVRRPQDVRYERDHGFSLGNHTWDHPQMTKLDAAAQAREMDTMTAEQRALVGTDPCVFRPPYGLYDETTLRLAHERNMSVWLWSVDPEDWKADGSGSQYWVDRIVSRAIAGGSQAHPVILFHNQPIGNPATVAALPRVIDYYRSHGYTFVALGPQPQPPPKTGSLPGVVRGDQWYLRYSRTTGPGDASFHYGAAGARYVTGDWDANGTTTPGYVAQAVWNLRNANSAGAPDRSFRYGIESDLPVAGDWDGNGSTTPGVVRGNTWYLRNSNTPGGAQVSFTYGQPGDTMIVGDWDGNGTYTPGFVRGTMWYLRNSNSTGPPDIVFSYGVPTDKPIVGDWDGNGTSTPGVVRGNLWLLRNSASGGAATITFAFGGGTDLPVTGVWR